MSNGKALRVIIVKPSKYGVTGHVERFYRGFMPNSTLSHMRSMTPEKIDGHSIETVVVDEYVQTDLEYLKLLKQDSGRSTLLAVVGVQSHQFQRSLDLAAYALSNGVRHCIIGGPHPMTCDTTAVQNRGVSFSLSEAEVVWESILRDALAGQLQPLYDGNRRWQQELQAPVLVPPSAKDLRRYILPMASVYPARGCPFTCNFCSVIKIAGRRIRTQDLETTMASLMAMKKAGVRLVMFTSDNFNKYVEARELLAQMIEVELNIPFFVQCDTQVARDEEFIELLGRAGCFQVFVGVESFSRKALLAAHKAQNHPETYSEIVRLCKKYGINAHFSNMIGFPGETSVDVREQLRILDSLGPGAASFYILTAIPGTEQYADFLAAGRIYERNLDRFDTTTTTWTHDIMSAVEIQDLLFECYRTFYAWPKIARTTADTIRPKSGTANAIPSLGMALFARYCAWKRVHPMSGGIGRALRDRDTDYRKLRRARYGLDLVPLPQNLNLSPSDEELNRRVNVAV
jgi:hypothetical protein